MQGTANFVLMLWRYKTKAFNTKHSDRNRLLYDAVTASDSYDLGQLVRKLYQEKNYLRVIYG